MNWKEAIIRKQFLAALFLSLAACATNNDVATYYRQNPNVAITAPKKAEPAFILTDRTTIKSTIQSYMANGYRVLGISDFTDLIGAPMRTQALAYGKRIGADLIVYTMWPLGPEVHPVNRLVMDSPGGYITTTTDANVSGGINYYGDLNGYGTYSGTGTATSSTYVPPQFHTVVTPETFYRSEHGIAFLARSP